MVLSIWMKTCLPHRDLWNFLKVRKPANNSRQLMLTAESLGTPPPWHPTLPIQRLMSLSWVHGRVLKWETLTFSMSDPNAEPSRPLDPNSRALWTTGNNSVTHFKRGSDCMSKWSLRRFNKGCRWNRHSGTIVRQVATTLITWCSHPNDICVKLQRSRAAWIVQAGVEWATLLTMSTKEPLWTIAWAGMRDTFKRFMMKPKLKWGEPEDWYSDYETSGRACGHGRSQCTYVWDIPADADEPQKDPGVS